MHHDPRPARDVPQDQLGGALDPLEARGVMRLAGLEERPRRRRLPQAPADEHLRRRVRDPQLPLERQHGIHRAGRDLEAAVHAAPEGMGAT